MRLELEKILIGSLILNASSDARRLGLEFSDFINNNARAAFMALCELKEAGRTIDIALVKAHAGRTTPDFPTWDYLSAAVNSVVSSKSFYSYAVELKKSIFDAKLVELKRNTSMAIKDAGELENLLDQVREEERALKAKYLQQEFVNDFPLVMCEMLQEIEMGEAPKYLLKTGISFLDSLSGGGYLPPEYIVIAGRPSNGKTALAIQMMCALGMNSVKCSCFSLEMTKRQIFGRILAFLSHVDTRKFLRSPHLVTPEEKTQAFRFRDQMLEIGQNILVHDQASQTVDTVRAQAREDVANGAKYIVVDYLQRFQIEGDNRNTGVGNISNRLQDVAKELNVPIFVLCQLNRSVETQNRLPMLSDLRDSGSIEQDADTIVFLHRTEEVEAQFKSTIIQAKGRNSGTGTRKTIFKKLHQTFYEEARS